MSEPLLRVDDLKVHFPVSSGGLLGRPAGMIRAVDGVSFTLGRGETLGLVGESGCGKSTTGLAVMRMNTPVAGRIEVEGQDITHHDKVEMQPLRRRMQMVYQDPYGSLDPRRRVAQTVAEPLAVLHGASPAEQRERAAEMLDAVGLRASDLDKYPHEFSGGQRQRIAIARALVTRPRLIVADEPVSALDVSVQAQVLNLMQDLQDRFGVTYLFISHDIAVVDLVCDEVIVLPHGRIVEQGPPDALFRHPQHAYTRRLLDAVPGR